MPALRWREMPAGQRIPESFRRTAEEYGLLDRPAPQRTFRDSNFEQQFTQAKKMLQEQWQIEANALRTKPFKSQAQANAELAKLNSKYQMQELEARQKLETQEQAQQQKQQYIMGLRGRKKALTDVELYQAQRTLTEEEERFARLPTDGKPFTFTQIASLGKFIQATAEKAEEEPWKFGKKRTRKSLIDQYLAVTDVLKIEDPQQQQQFNEVWNRVMETDKNFANWFDKQGRPPVEMKITGAKGTIARAMKQRAVGKSPIAKSFLKLHPAFRAGTWLAGDRGRVTSEQPQQQIPRPTTQTEYNRVSSGSQYIATDGSIRTKR